MAQLYLVKNIEHNPTNSIHHLFGFFDPDLESCCASNRSVFFSLRSFGHYNFGSNHEIFWTHSYRSIPRIQIIWTGRLGASVWAQGCLGAGTSGRKAFWAQELLGAGRLGAVQGVPDMCFRLQIVAISLGDKLERCERARWKDHLDIFFSFKF